MDKDQKQPLFIVFHSVPVLLCGYLANLISAECCWLQTDVHKALAHVHLRVATNESSGQALAYVLQAIDTLLLFI